MHEIREILTKYDESYISTNLHSVADINKFAGTFYKDVAEIYDCITRVRNIERNPAEFSLHDAPILGLLVRIWKLLKEIIKYYEADNAEIISILERPLIEAAVTATYLLENDQSVIEDYRKCSYKDRLRILRDVTEGSPFFETKAGKRLLRSVQEKMTSEGLTADDFDLQKRNRWRLQGKPFSKIFSQVVNEQLYVSTYGMMSESIHGSWNESMDYCLHKNEDGNFSTFPFYHEADVRYVTPTIRFCNMPFRPWLRRIEADEKYLIDVLDWIDRVNTALFIKFDDTYDT
jgi:hypothetical protein